MKKLKSNSGDIIIVYEDPDYLIVNKPANLITHKSHNKDEVSLADILLNNYPEIKLVGEDENRPGIVHRLDKEVSGLLIIARNQKSFEYFKNLFKNRKIHKEYEAIIYGSPSKDEVEITFPITRAKSGFKMAALPLTSKENKSKISNRERGNEKARTKSKEALTKFSVIKKWPHVSVISIIIVTGRTHQIRVHLAAYGYPILGDNLYGTTKTIRKNQKQELNRVYLYAKKLIFPDLNGEKKEFTITAPDTLKCFINKQK
ncbi:MAG: RNA pseudouridine synthase [Clostridia bacterium]|nr:RNA pseudouridine synthase [Clostridia bacterium]